MDVTGACDYYHCHGVLAGLLQVRKKKDRGPGSCGIQMRDLWQDEIFHDEPTKDLTVLGEMKAQMMIFGSLKPEKVLWCPLKYVAQDKHSTKTVKHKTCMYAEIQVVLFFFAQKSVCGGETSPSLVFLGHMAPPLKASRLLPSRSAASM